MQSVRIALFFVFVPFSRFVVKQIEIICHGAQKEFLTRISWGITKTLRGTIWLAEQFTVSNPWVGYTNHSFAKIPIRFMT